MHCGSMRVGVLMAKSEAKKPERTEASERGTTSVTVRLANDLVAWLDNRAEQENRSRANLIETLLKRAKEQPQEQT
jgi:hypothetical protein